MKKLFAVTLSVLIAVACIFAFAACGDGSGKDYSAEIANLQSQLDALKNTNNSLQSDLNDLNESNDFLQNQLDSLKSENDSLKSDLTDALDRIEDLENSGDIFTGSPKFIYNINETIPYYINGTKIFDFIITVFDYEPTSTTAIKYSVNFYNPAFETSDLRTVFTAKLYDENTTDKIFASNSNTSGSMYFNVHTGNSETIILYYLEFPFASITAIPTLFS